VLASRLIPEIVTAGAVPGGPVKFVPPPTGRPYPIPMAAARPATDDAMAIFPYHSRVRDASLQRMPDLFLARIRDRYQRFSFKRLPPAAPSREFVKWSETDPLLSAPAIHSNSYLAPTTPDGAGYAARLVTAINNRLQTTGQFDVDIRHGWSAQSVVSEIDGGIATYDTVINRITIGANTAGTLSFSNVSIHELIIGPQAVPAAYLFHRCNIGRILVRGNNSPCHVELTVGNSSVGTIELGCNAVKYLAVVRSAVLDFDLPPTYSGNPFVGSVIFRKNYFPRRRIHGYVPTAQSFRNLRHHLLALQNSQMANDIHSIEQAVERMNDDRPLNRLFSWLYEGTSDFGSSTSRPLLLLLLLWSFGIAFLYYTHGAAIPADADPKIYFGWRSALTDPTWGDYAKAIALSSQQTINPFGLLRTHSTVLPANGWLSLWGVIHGVFSATFIALFILALRRRFRLQ
jgi:hypothetical protein